MMEKQILYRYADFAVNSFIPSLVKTSVMQLYQSALPASDILQKGVKNSVKYCDKKVYYTLYMPHVLILF